MGIFAKLFKEDKLDKAIKFMRSNPNATDESLAKHMRLQRAASARFYRLRALDIIRRAQNNGHHTDCC